MTTETPDMLGGWPPPVLDPAGPFAGPVTIATVSISEPSWLCQVSHNAAKAKKPRSGLRKR